VVKQHLPIVGVTIGDAAGIGPEVVVKAVQRADVHEVCRPLIIGDARVFATDKFAAYHADVHSVAEVPAVEFAAGALTVLDLHNLDPEAVSIGEVNAAAGGAAVDYVRTAAELALAGEIDAIATAPLNKAALRAAGYDYIGHTELLADLTETADCTTMLSTPGLRVTHVTRHVPFREIPLHITEDRVLRTITVTDRGLKALGFAAPRIAVAGLNPHNGEEGLLGREEIDVIAPTVRTARRHGIDVDGPLSPDSVFVAALRGDFDVVVCMYHDQGHIAVKTHNFAESITVTLGLPIVRTSADHGTAFDIAGQGVADAESMAAAMIAAARMATQRADPGA
jgi:4-hydroxythreonine-4-phosphate dehydrogenase